MRKTEVRKGPNVVPRPKGRTKSGPSHLHGYVTWLASQPVAELTRRTYRRRVAAYLAWLEKHPGERYGDPMSDTFARDYAVRDYKHDLKTVGKAAPASVNGALAAIDHFYRYLGLGPVNVRREQLPSTSPQAIAIEEQRWFLRAVERAAGKPRNAAIALLIFYTGLRLAECAALNVDDVVISARRGRVMVRAGKGDAYREVPLNRDVRQALTRWLAERRAAEVETDALFVNRNGGRLSPRSIHEVLNRLAAEAGVRLSARVLRHTCLTRLVRAGNDLVLVAEIAGHRRLETTRRYSLPSTADREAAMETSRVEY